MAGENLQSTLAGYAAFNEGRRVPELEFWHEDSEYHASSSDPDSDVHRGIEAVRRQTARWVDAYPDLRVEPLEAREHGEKVFVWVRFVGHGAASGLPMEMELAHVITVREGRTASLHEYQTRAEGLAALGQAEGSDDEVPYLVVDAFTDAPLRGNQLAVFPNAAGLADDQMQRLAREMNYSESIFVLPAEGDGDVRVRIFTPSLELAFAGHPVLGCAFALGESLGLDTVRLETGLGLIPVELERRDGKVAFGRMQQAIPAWEPYPRERELLAALGVDASQLPVEAYPNGPYHVYVALDSEDAVGSLSPDFGALAELGEVAVNCFAGSGRRWKTRMFAAGAGVFEDPATGSAAGPLAIHLARHGRISFGEQIEIRQGAEIGRPSMLYARVDGSPERIERVEVGGCAVLVARGAFARSALEPA
jgi:trans-2,3-dihydro-3-hydroxyanthranilate isomerase